MNFIRTRFASACALFVGLGAIAVLVGWHFDIGTLKSFSPNFKSIKANNAVLFGLMALALWCLQRPERRYRASAVALSIFSMTVAGLVLWEHHSGINLGFDELLYKDPAGYTGLYAPGRFAPITALIYILLGFAFCVSLIRRESAKKVAQFFDFCIFLVSFQGFVGYLCGLNSTFGFSFFSQMAFQTTVLFTLLSLGHASLHVKEGFLKVFTSRTAGGIMAQKFLAFAVVLPPVFSWLESFGERYAWFDSDAGVLMRITGSTGLLIFFVWKSANELHQSEIKRGKSQRDFEELCEAMPQIVWTTDSQGKPNYCNRRWHDFAGVSIHEVSREPGRETIHPEDYAKVQKALELSLREGKGYETEFRILSKEGRYEFFLSRVVPIFDEKGRLIRRLGTLTNIDQQKRFQEEQALMSAREAASKTNNEHLTAIIATQYEIATATLDFAKLLDIIVQKARLLVGGVGAVVEMIDGEEMLYQAASGPAAKFIGLRLKRNGSFSGLCVTQREPLICEDSETDPRVDINACRRIGVRSMIAVPLFHRDRTLGVLKVYSDQAKAFSTENVNTLQLMAGLLAAAMSQGQALEERRSAQEEAQRATQAKSQFLANMSHEIRTPLNGIIGVANLLAERPLGSDEKRYAHIIQTSSASLLNIINDVLDFSKIEANRLELEAIDFDLRNLISTQSDLLAERARAKGLSVSTEIDPIINPHLLGDPGRIGQILLNLIGNAIKFTDRGSIQIRVFAEGQTVKSGPFLRFEITDTGVGLSSEASAKLFTPFTQADGSTARRFGGTGLGLSISKRLVELMDGSIGVRSIEGQGSTFWFRIPYVPGRATPSENATKILGPQVWDKAFHVLVAEDNPVNQLVASKILSQLGISSQSVANGKEAIEAFKRGPLDLIFMDCQMPEMDGYSATQAIREIEKSTGGRIPIIALTANALKEDELKCLEHGMDDFLSKPVLKHQVLAKLKHWLPAERKAA